jgi:hypothetical protein
MRMKNRPAKANLLQQRRAALSPVTVMMPAAPVPMMVPAVVVMPVEVTMPAPAHFRGELFRILLHNSRSTRIDQRQRLRPLEGSRNNKQRADSRERQNFRSVHQHSPYIRDFTPAPCGRLFSNCSAATRESYPGEGDVNAD